jgi:hypothetical protein
MEASRNDFVQKWFSHSNAARPSHSQPQSLTHRKSLSIRPLLFAKSCRRLNEHLPKVTHRIILRGKIEEAKSLGATIKNKRRLASSFLVVCKFGWKRTLLSYIGDEKAARIIKDIFMPVSCMANFIYLCCVYRSSALYCAVAVQNAELWMSKLAAMRSLPNTG